MREFLVPSAWRGLVSSRSAGPASATTLELERRLERLLSYGDEGAAWAAGLRREMARLHELLSEESPDASDEEFVEQFPHYRMALLGLRAARALLADSLGELIAIWRERTELAGSHGAALSLLRRIRDNHHQELALLQGAHLLDIPALD